MPKLRIGDTELYYESLGQGPALLFIHGLGSSTRDWKAQVDDFVPWFRVVTFDLRGHGRSDRPTGPYSIPAFAADTAELIRRLGLGPAHVVGLSLGGMIAFQLAVSAPELVRSLTIVNSGPEFIPRTLKARVRIAQRKFIVRWRGMRAMGRFLGQRLFPEPAQAELRQRFIDRWAENDPGAYLEALQAMVGWTVADRLEDIRCPALVVAADRDYTPIAAKEAYVARMPRAELAVVRDARHMLPVERPADFNRVLLDWPRGGPAALDVPLWQPSAERIEATDLHRFRQFLQQREAIELPDCAALHRFSVERMESFWRAVWDFCGVVAETRGERVLADREKMPGTRFFPNARLNFAENLLRCRDDGDALVFWGEDRVRRRLSRRELYDLTSRLAQALAADGIGPGDRVAAFLPNLPETVIAMLAAASLGAVFTACSPDFGVDGALSRFGQIGPKLLFGADGYFYNGKRHASLERLQGIAAGLPGLSRIVIVDYTGEPPSPNSLDARAVGFENYLAPHPARDIPFVRLPFNAPLYILYSSGTTGLPKCILHGAGGTLLKHLEEHRLQCDIRANDRVFYYTTCGWMMWHWLVSGLASGATLLLYDGSPFHPSGEVLFDFADAEGMTHFGTSAKYLDALAKAGLEPARTHRLAALRTLLSTGSPLAPEAFEYVYRHIKADLCLSSISGGSDIVGCFVGGNPISPVWRGEIQTPLLGMAVDVFDEAGRPVSGGAGELVCTKPFPSMPLGFWNDPDGEKYRDAYFATYPNVWRQGDWAEITAHGGIIIHGRSDTTLNPGGVRIGTAEIYRQVEQIDEVLESLVVGQAWENDTRVLLFVRLRKGLALDTALAEHIRRRIRNHASPRHVPAKIISVADLPRTRSGKLAELAVREFIHGRPVRNREALANPEALDLLRDRPELKS